MGLETVLVAVGDAEADRLDNLTDVTLDIGGPAGSSIELVHIYTSAEYESAKERLHFDEGSEATPEAVAKRHAPLRNMREEIENAGLSVGVHGSLTDDDESEKIVEIADLVEADLIVVGGQKRSPTGKAVFGSTAQKVMMNAPCPVTFVKAG